MQIDINGECCGKECDSEEFHELEEIYSYGYSANNVRTNLQLYLAALYLVSYLKAVRIVALVV